MEEAQFWNIIDAARVVADGDQAAERRAIEAALAKLPPDEILLFQTTFNRLHAASYTERLWGAAYVMNGGCSDDGFDYFRGWLIAQGQAVFVAAVKDPDSLADHIGGEPDPNGYEFEDMLSIAATPWTSATGGSIQDFYAAMKRLPQLARPPLADFSWTEDDHSLQQSFPRLTAAFAT